MSRSFDDWVNVVAAPGEAAATARALLAVADDPRDVRSVGTGGEFLVPAYVADAYHGISITTEPAAKPRRRTKKSAEETES